MSKFLFNGKQYMYTVLISEEFVEDFNSQAIFQDKYTMYGDLIFTWRGDIYCVEDDSSIWCTEEVSN